MKPEVPLPHSQQSTPVPILSHINLVHALSSHLSKIRFNIILPSTPCSSSGLFPSDLPTKILYALLPFPTRATYCLRQFLDGRNFMIYFI